MASSATGTAPAAPLPARYYRDNFLTVCRTVEENYADLLAVSERQWLARFTGLPLQAQCLYVRLISRLGPWFRLSRIHYAEIPDNNSALAALLAAGLVEEAEALTVDMLGRLYTRPELRGSFTEALTPPGASKAQDIDRIGAWIDRCGMTDAAVLCHVCGDTGERVIAPTGLAQVELLQLLFFGNRRQSLTDFVLSDIGVAKYYPYALDRQYRLFNERAAVDDYLQSGYLTDAFDTFREAGDGDAIVGLARELVTVPVAHTASERRWWRLFNRVGRELERAGELSLALQLYQRSALHPSRERSARVLEGMGMPADALALCHQILSQPRGEEEAAAARRMLPRLQRKSNLKPQPRARDRFDRMELLLEPSGEGVEQDVARALSAQWRQVHFVENSLMNGLFGLAFWDQIFSPVAGAFHNPFQSVPADMYDGRFLPRRREALEARLQVLASGDLGAALRQVYTRVEGYQCRWLNWRVLSLPLVEEAVAAIPRQHLVAVWRRMLFDPGENRRGFPDLIALGEGPGDYLLVEVKGPGDALQESQKRWLRFFAAEGVPATVAWVRWCEEGVNA